MNELTSTFHIELNFLFAQLINFTIVLLVLYKFAYKPILKVLNERTKKIEKGLKDSEEASKKLEEVSKKEKQILAKAREEAQAIISHGEESAKKSQKEILIQTENQSQKILQNAQKQIKEEKKKTITEIKKEVADLVVVTTEKMVGEKLDSSRDKEFIEKIIKQEAK